MSLVDTLKADIVPAALSAGMGIFIDKYLLGQNLSANSKFLSIGMPRWASVGATVFTADMIAEVVQTKIQGYIPQVQGINLPKAVVSGVGVIGLEYFGDRSISYGGSFVLGAGSTIAGSIVAGFIKKKMNPN